MGGVLFEFNLILSTAVSAEASLALSFKASRFSGSVKSKKESEAARAK